VTDEHIGRVPQPTRETATGGAACAVVMYTEKNLLASGSTKLAKTCQGGWGGAIRWKLMMGMEI
jgi:hypothetical protein